MAHVRPRKHGTLCKFFWYVNYFPISFWKDLYQVLLRIYLCQCWTVKFKGITHQMLFYNFLLGFCHPSKTQYVWRMLVIYFKNGSAIIREQQGCIYFKVVHFFPNRGRLFPPFPFYIFVLRVHSDSFCGLNLPPPFELYTSLGNRDFTSRWF